jgi:hypothetical protein
MIDNDAIVYLESPAARSGFDNLAAGFMSGDHSGHISLGSLAKMFVIDTSDI